jgi:hypothetical protein
MGGKDYSGHNFTYTPPPYNGQVKDPVTRFVFGNGDFAKQLKGIEVGDYVELTFDNSKFKNPESIKKISTSYNGDARQESIVRQSALKQAINLMDILKGTGAYTAANLKKKDYVVQQVVEIAQAFEPYLFAQIDVEEVESVDVPWKDPEQEGYNE